MDKNHMPSSVIRLQILIALLVILVLPALNNVHYEPQPQFWAEITVVWGIIALFIINLTHLKRLSLPIISVPLFLLMLLFIWQPNFIKLSFPGLNYIAATEMFLAIILAININSLRITYGLPYLTLSLIKVLLIGAIFQSIIGFIQYTGTPHYFGSLIFYDSLHPTTNIFGHFGQRNHYADYLSWSVFGLCYLFLTKRIKPFWFYSLILWFSFSLTIAASRSIFIYFGLFIIISLLYLIIKRDNLAKKLFLLSLLISLILVGVEYFYPLIHDFFSAKSVISSGLKRLDTMQGMGRRTVEWLKAWQIFKSHPILGVGFEGYSYQGLILNQTFANVPLNSGLFTNCHNLILQFLAEMGLVGALILVLGILTAIFFSLKNLNLEITIIMSMLFTILAHSMNEYPLWYFYFLAPLVGFLSLDRGIFSFDTKIIRNLSLLPLIGLVYWFVTISFTFDRLVSYYDVPTEKAQFKAQVKYLENLTNNTWFSYYAIYTLDNYINLNSSLSQKNIPLNNALLYSNKLLYFHPYPETLIKAAKLNYLSHNYKEAVYLVKLATDAYPVYIPSFINSLKNKKFEPLYKVLTTNINGIKSQE